ncbi:MAG: SDR family NAD(P)-dependent oxidoreductase [Candidatus Methanomethylicaceae archaeon]
MNGSNSVLITGGTGLVGVHAAYKFASEDFNVIIFDLNPREIDFLEEVKDRLTIIKGDVTKIEDLLNVTSKYNVEGIVHTAAIPREPICREKPMQTFMVNVGGTLNVLEVARQKNLKVVYISTQAVYGKRPDLKPLTENDPVYPVGIYGTQKLIGEFLTTSYNIVYNLDTVSIRTSWVYGPALMTIPNPPSIFLEKVLAGESIILPSGGDHPLDYTYVKDLANGIFLAFTKRPIQHRVFNISGGKLYTLHDVAEAIKKVIPEAKIELGPGLWEELLRQAAIRGPADITYAQQELGYKPRYSLEEGIKEYAEWLIKQKKLRKKV